MLKEATNIKYYCTDFDIFMLQIENNDDEVNFAKEALFSRHPEMSSWPKGTQAISNMY